MNEAFAREVFKHDCGLPTAIEPVGLSFAYSRAQSVFNIIPNKNIVNKK